jgi:CBS domain containing-hemolysin-like protein
MLYEVNMKKKQRFNFRWVIRTFILTFSLAVIFSIISETLLRQVSIYAAFAMLLFIIMIGIFFDAVGISVAAADEKPFHAMAASRVKGAKYAIMLIKNASKVSNFCNDVIGDIAGIISGTTIGIIVSFFDQYNIPEAYQALIAIGISGLVAALTVGGKALGKEIAIGNAKQVVNLTGRILYYAHRLVQPKTYVDLFKRSV